MGSHTQPRTLPTLCFLLICFFVARQLSSGGAKNVFNTATQKSKPLAQMFPFFAHLVQDDAQLVLAASSTTHLLNSQGPKHRATEKPYLESIPPSCI